MLCKMCFCCLKESHQQGKSRILFIVVSRWQHVCCSCWCWSVCVWCTHSWYYSHCPIGKEGHLHMFLSGKFKLGVLQILVENVCKIQVLH